MRTSRPSVRSEGRCRWSPCRWLIRTTSMPAQVAGSGSGTTPAQQPDGVGQQGVGEHGAARPARRGRSSGRGSAGPGAPRRKYRPSLEGPFMAIDAPGERGVTLAGTGSPPATSTASSSTVRSCGSVRPCSRSTPVATTLAAQLGGADAAGDADQAEALGGADDHAEHVSARSSVVARGQRGQVDADHVERDPGHQREDAVPHAVVVQAEADAGPPRRPPARARARPRRSAASPR